MAPPGFLSRGDAHWRVRAATRSGSEGRRSCRLADGSGTGLTSRFRRANHQVSAARLLPGSRQRAPERRHPGCIWPLRAWGPAPPPDCKPLRHQHLGRKLSITTQPARFLRRVRPWSRDATEAACEPRDRDETPGRAPRPPRGLRFGPARCPPPPRRSPTDAALDDRTVGLSDEEQGVVSSPNTVRAAVRICSPSAALPASAVSTGEVISLKSASNRPESDKGCTSSGAR